MRRILAPLSLVLVTAPSLTGETVTLPAVASLVGGNPFFSDVRVFNTSYTSSLSVTATYRCFIGTAQASCPASAPVLNFTLAARQARAFNDMVAAVDGFNAHDTAGGVEFEYSGSGDQLVVTSRLFSTSPQNSVGMFIPGLDNSDAHPTTVLTSIRHSADFRTNVGIYNREDSGVSVTFTIFDDGRNQVGSPVTRNVGGHAGLQISGIFEAAGAGSVDTSNAVIVVAASGEVFSYAAVLDNRTADPIFVVGAEDQPPQPITPVATVAPSATPTPPGATVVNLEATRFQWKFNGGGSTFTMTVGQPYQIVLNGADPGEPTAHAFSGNASIGLNGHDMSGPKPWIVEFTPGPEDVGSREFHCVRFCGPGHPGMAGSIQIVP